MIRKAIYTTNSVEALHRSLRKIIKTRGAFPNEESARRGIMTEPVLAVTAYSGACEYRFRGDVNKDSTRM